MKVNLNELKLVIEEIVLEAKKSKKKKKDAPDKAAGTAGAAYGQYAPAFDFSKPLGKQNLYKLQGAANWGPYTNSGDDSLGDNLEGLEESTVLALRTIVRSVIDENTSIWENLVESKEEADPEETPWDKALKTHNKK